MKKWSGLIACLLTIIAWMGCGRKAPQAIGTPAIPENAVTMHATILSFDNGSMLVEPIPGADELRSSDRFIVPMAHMDASPEPLVGDVVEIFYDGTIQETYPASPGSVYFVRVIRENPPAAETAAFTKEEGDTTVKIDGIVYYNTKIAVPVEPDERVIVHTELPLDGSFSGKTVTAYAFLSEEKTGDLLVCQIDGEWYRFAVTDRAGQP